MENKLYFIIIISSCIVLFLGVIEAIIFLLLEQKQDWSDYDSYILSLSWGPSSCYNKKEKKEECFNELDKLDINKSFIIHGLWPTYSSGEYINNCNKGEDIEVNFNKLYADNLSKIWPNLNLTNENIWEYEYNQHGYCYIQRLRKHVERDFELYFDKAKELFSNYNELMESTLPDTQQGLQRIAKERMQLLLKESAFKLNESTYSLRCEKNEEKNVDLLNEIWINYDFNLIDKANNSHLDDNCPKTFYIYFRDKNKVPVYLKYDFYLLTLYWPVTYCKMFGEECYKKFKKRELNILTIHGLWPSYQTGVIPQYCNLDTDIQVDFYNEDMNKYWVNTYNQENKVVWNIEYNKHGFCYNQRNNIPTKNYMNYFNKTLELYHKFNLKDKMHKDFFPKIYGGENKITLSSLQDKLSEYFGDNTYSITCKNINGTYYLKEIRLKLDLNFSTINKGKGGDDCPGEFIAEFLEVEGPKPQAPEDYYKKYDMYTLSIEWQETQCRDKGKYCYDRIPKETKDKFSIHGLWTNLRNGYIEQGFCNGKNDIDIYIRDESLLNFMKLYYVGLIHSNDFFWGHVYNKHGYCFNKRLNHDVNDYEFYFNKIKDLFINYNLANLFIDFFKKEQIEIKEGDMSINRIKFEDFLTEKGFAKDVYTLACKNFTDEYNNTYSHISEMRIRYDLDFNLLKNETEVSDFDCPEIFYAQFM